MSELKSVLVVGVGSIGERHLRCFQRTGRARLSLCELNPALRATVSDRYGITDAHGDLDSALAAKPEIVVVCTPAHLHIEVARKSVGAGAHLLIEKPLSTSFEGIGRLSEELQRRQRTAVVAYVYRAHPTLTAMRDAILSGRFGEPLELVVVGGQHFPLYRPAYREIYYRDRAQGGGAVQDALTHLVNAGEWLVGPVTRVAADYDHLNLPGVSVEDTVHVICRHGSVLGSYALNQHQAPNETSITLIGSKGAARFEVHANRWRWMTEPGGQWQEEHGGEMERDTLFVLQAQAFLDTVEGKRPPLCTVEEGVQTLRVNLAILEAGEKQTWVSVEKGPTP